MERDAFVLVERKPDGTLVRKGLYTVPEAGGPPTEIVAGGLRARRGRPTGSLLVFAMGSVGARRFIPCASTAPT